MVAKSIKRTGQEPKRLSFCSFPFKHQQTMVSSMGHGKVVRTDVVHPHNTIVRGPPENGQFLFWLSLKAETTRATLKKNPTPRG